MGCGGAEEWCGAAHAVVRKNSSQIHIPTPKSYGILPPVVNDPSVCKHERIQPGDVHASDRALRPHPLVFCRLRTGGWRRQDAARCIALAKQQNEMPDSLTRCMTHGIVSNVESDTFPTDKKLFEGDGDTEIKDWVIYPAAIRYRTSMMNEATNVVTDIGQK